MGLVDNARQDMMLCSIDKALEQEKGMHGNAEQETESTCLEMALVSGRQLVVWWMGWVYSASVIGVAL